MNSNKISKCLIVLICVMFIGFFSKGAAALQIPLISAGFQQKVEEMKSAFEENRAYEVVSYFRENTSFTFRKRLLKKLVSFVYSKSLNKRLSARWVLGELINIDVQNRLQSFEGPAYLLKVYESLKDSPVRVLIEIIVFSCRKENTKNIESEEERIRLQNIRGGADWLYYKIKEINQSAFCQLEIDFDVWKELLENDIDDNKEFNIEHVTLAEKLETLLKGVRDSFNDYNQHRWSKSPSLNIRPIMSYFNSIKWEMQELGGLLYQIRNALPSSRSSIEIIAKSFCEFSEVNDESLYRKSLGLGRSLTFSCPEAYQYASYQDIMCAMSSAFDENSKFLNSLVNRLRNEKDKEKNEIYEKFRQMSKAWSSFKREQLTLESARRQPLRCSAARRWDRLRELSGKVNFEAKRLQDLSREIMELINQIKEEDPESAMKYLDRLEEKRWTLSKEEEFKSFVKDIRERIVVAGNSVRRIKWFNNVYSILGQCT